MCPLWDVQLEGDRGRERAGSTTGPEVLCCLLQLCALPGLVGGEGESISTLQPLCWVRIQEQGSASGLAGALCCCSAPGRGWGSSCQGGVGGLTSPRLCSTSSCRDIAAATASSPAQEAVAGSGAGSPVGFLQWGMPFTAWCSCHGISSAVLTATSLQSPILQPHSSSSGVSLLWALQGQYPLSCLQPSNRAMGCRVPKRLCSIVAKLELCCCWEDAATTKGAANFSHLFFHQRGIKQ